MRAAMAGLLAILAFFVVGCSTGEDPDVLEEQELKAILATKTGDEIYQEYREKLVGACLVVDPGPNRNLLVLRNSCAEVEQPDFMARRTDGSWNLYRIDLGTSGMKRLVQLVSVRSGSDKLPLLHAIAVNAMGEQGLVQIKVRSDGIAEATGASERFTNAHFDGGGPVLIVEQPADLGENDYLACTECLARAKQTVLQDDRERYYNVGSRIRPTPYVTVTQFLAALAKRNRSAAADYAVDAQVAARAQELLQPDQVKWEGPTASALDQFPEVDRDDWNAIPQAFREPLPAEVPTIQFPLRSGQREVKLELKYEGHRWLVAGVQE